MNLESTVYKKESYPNLDELHVKNHKKEIKRIDWEIVKRVVVLLFYENRMKRTNIAMKCKLGYGSCLLYLNWLEVMDLIKRETDRDGYELISLSDKGKELYVRQLQKSKTISN